MPASEPHVAKARTPSTVQARRAARAAKPAWRLNAAYEVCVKLCQKVCNVGCARGEAADLDLLSGLKRQELGAFFVLVSHS